MSGGTKGLRAEGLRKRLGGRPVVDGISLGVAPGEVVGLLGPNGAGKTTVFNMLMGLARPDEGRVTLGETDITRLPPYQRALLGIGHLPQGQSIFLGLSVQQNVLAVLQLRREAGRQTMEEADALLSTFGLSDVAEQRASTLSGGERRRLELAKLMAGAPKVLLLDEPLAGLDPLAMDGFIELLRGVQQEGLAILLTDHNVHQALTICTKAYILVDGCILVSGSTGEVIEHSAARSQFWGSSGLGA